MNSQDLPIIPIGVTNAPFALDLLARDCPPTQFLREMTRNGIEAIEAYVETVDPDYRGEVIWTVDPLLHALEGRSKLACIDTGIGMSGHEMVTYLNDLTASGKIRSLTGNYGIGAKVSAAKANPHGVIYCSWQEGRGHMAATGRDAAGVWGMRQHRLADGSVSAILPLGRDVMPDEIAQAGGHGTCVVFLGEDEAADTTSPPAADLAERWIAKALNQRFYEVPEYVTIRAREIKTSGKTESVFLRQVRGQRHFLDQHTIAQGSVSLTGAVAYWRILDERHAERAKEAGIFASTGHRAALFGDELFELVAPSRGGYQKVQEFGIRFGYERVVILVELPHSASVGQDSVRSQVKVDGEPLPWDRYAAEFEQKMPEELRIFQEELATGSDRDQADAIDARLETIADQFDIPRYRPADSGEALIQEGVTGGRHRRRGEPRPEPQPAPELDSDEGTVANVYALFQDSGEQPAESVEASTLPRIDVNWVSVADGTRSSPHLEDRAARYDRRHNYLELNADFRGYVDVVERWAARYAGVPGARSAVEDAVGTWWRQALQETVYGLLALRGSEWWDERCVEAALSQEALTAAAMQRYHLDQAVKRELGMRLGTLRSAA